MKKIISLLTLVIAVLFSQSVFAFTPPDRPLDGGHVVDFSGELSPTEILNLENKISAINIKTNNEFGILLLSDMGDSNIEDVAHATFNHWGIGKKDLDNGCLIVVSIKDRKSRIETGKGVGGEITDIEASSILKKHLAPHFKQGHHYQGLDRTLDALSEKMETRANGDAKSNGLGILGIIFIILLIIFVLWLMARCGVSFIGSGGSWGGGSSGGSSFGGGSSGGGGASSDF